MSYLNHAGTSWPKPLPVRQAVAAALASPPADWPAAFDATRRRVAQAFGIPAPERLLFTPGCTSALALAIYDHPWQVGDRILTSALEHHALQRPVLQLRERGVESCAVPRDNDSALDLEALERELRRGRVRLVALTAACNVTGELLPVAEVVALAHEHGALCLVDGAQLCGWQPLDLTALQVDLFAFAGHKGLQGPSGIGGLYVAPQVGTTTPAATCELPANGRSACAPMPGYCDGGSLNQAALAGLAAALDWLDAPERVDRLRLARQHVEQLASALEERRGVRLHGARDPGARLPTIAFTREGRSTADVAATFAAAGVTVGAGLQCAPLAHETLGTARDGVVRLSTGPATSAESVERALEVVSSL